MRGKLQNKIRDNQFSRKNLRNLSRFSKVLLKNRKRVRCRLRCLKKKQTSDFNRRDSTMRP